MRHLVERTETLRSRPRSRTLLLCSSAPPVSMQALYRCPSNWQLRRPEPYVTRRRQNYLLLLESQGTAPTLPIPPIPPVVTLGPNSAQVVFAPIDYQATVISQYANWSAGAAPSPYLVVGPGNPLVTGPGGEDIIL